MLLNGKATEGIFRVSADVDEVNGLKQQIDHWDVPEHKSTMGKWLSIVWKRLMLEYVYLVFSDAHAPASLLKLWYRELYDPLIPDDLYNECVATDHPDEVAAIINRLPALNKLVIFISSFKLSLCFNHTSRIFFPGAHIFSAFSATICPTRYCGQH